MCRVKIELRDDLESYFNLNHLVLRKNGVTRILMMKESQVMA